MCIVQLGISISFIIALIGFIGVILTSFQEPGSHEKEEFLSILFSISVILICILSPLSFLLTLIIGVIFK